MTPTTITPHVDLVELRKLEQQKLISIQQHPSLPYLIHNYTPVCQFDRRWTPLTVMCRGLITDLEGNIIARPFEKFFNLSEHMGADSKLPMLDWRQSFQCTQKMDGSLGIMYWGLDETPHIATRGSFTSDQAQFATRILRERYNWQEIRYTQGLTFLFEIIYPENRIVVDYHGMEDIVLLDIINNETGAGSSHSAIEKYSHILGCPSVSEIKFPEGKEPQQAVEEYAATNQPNDEGCVIRFADGTRVKVKFEEYVRLHKLLTGINSRHIWDHLRYGTGFEKLLEHVPDEFNEWVRGIVAELTEAYQKEEKEVLKVWNELKNSLIDPTMPPPDRKAWALQIIKYPKISSALFALLDGKKYDKFIWQKIKPPVSRPFHQDIDA